MVSQLMMVPVILKKGNYGQTNLEKLGNVTKSDEGWVLEYTSRVNYFGDDETFMYDFMAAIGSSGVDIGNNEIIRYEWDQAEKVKTPLPK